jgi:hypothetical protein
MAPWAFYQVQSADFTMRASPRAPCPAGLTIFCNSELPLESAIIEFRAISP